MALKIRRDVGMETMKFTAGANRSAGDVVTVEDTLGVVLHDVLSSVAGVIAWLIPAIAKTCKSTDVIAAGDELYWDSTNEEFTLTAAGNDRCALALEDAGNGVTEVMIYFNGRQNVSVAGTIKAIRQTVALADFTDGGAAIGTIALTAKLPVGAIVLGWKAVVTESFDATTTITLQAGDGSDVDRFNGAADPDIKAVATVGTAVNDGDGNAFCAAETTVTLTATEDTEWGDLSTGSMDFSLFYIETN
jgi:predicted RecA/RadA family phage recombinase